MRSLIGALRRLVGKDRVLQARAILRRTRDRFRDLRADPRDAGTIGPAGPPQREAAAAQPPSDATTGHDAPPAATARRSPSASPRTRRTASVGRAGPPRPEAFVAGAYQLGGLERDYRLYIPPSGLAGPTSLVVMLHGCKQDPEDFAAGTRMNERARDEGFFVLYPAQSALANPARCWNWYSPKNLQVGRGEAGLIMALVDAVLDRHLIDPRRVYVAGLSAGGAMAAQLVRTYPDRFAAVGIHSGVPAGVARDLISALAVMRGRHPRRKRPRPSTPDAIDAGIELGDSCPGVATIVFHGDEDKVSSLVNADRIIADTLDHFAIDAALAAVSASPVVAAAPGLPAASIEEGQTPGGCRWTRSTYDDGNCLLAEQWTLHGFGHAWSGGSPAGSYTDGNGPDATREMLRFFHAVTSRRRGSARPRWPARQARQADSGGWRVVSRS